MVETSLPKPGPRSSQSPFHNGLATCLTRTLAAASTKQAVAAEAVALWRARLRPGLIPRRCARSRKRRGWTAKPVWPGPGSTIWTGTAVARPTRSPRLAGGRAWRRGAIAWTRAEVGLCGRT